MKKISYHWAICIVCAFLIMCTGGFTSTNFTTLLPYIIKEIGLSNTEGALLTTIRSASSFVAVLGYDIFYNKLKIRLGTTVMTLNVGLTYILYAIADSFAGCCVAAVFAGISYGLGGMVVVSVIINRWFRSHIGLAMGLASCGTGVSSILFPPIITFIIEGSSLKTAFFAIACFCIVGAVLVFAVIRGRPSDLHMKQYYDGKEKFEATQIHLGEDADKGAVACIMAAAFIVGILSFCGAANMSVLLHETDLSSVTISFALSTFGMTLMGGKFLYGEAIDKLGPVKTGFIFLGVIIVGMVLCVFSVSGNIVIVMSAMACVGLGMSVASVALPIYARDISSFENYAKASKKIQLTYMTGSLTFATVPGIIADITGSYVHNYIMLSVFSVILLVLVECAYFRMRHKKRDAA